jgi:hypothetical protein
MKIIAFSILLLAIKALQNTVNCKTKFVNNDSFCVILFFPSNLGGYFIEIENSAKSFLAFRKVAVPILLIQI